MTDDPFATVSPTGSTATAVKEAPKKKAAPAAAPVEDAVPAEDPLASFLAEMKNSMTMDDDDYAPPTGFVANFIKPAEGTWLPIRIVSCVVETRDTKMVVAYTKKGERVTDPKLIDQLIETEGAEESIEEVTIFQFVVEAEPVATHFGERSSTYRLYTPVFPARIPYAQPRKRGGKTIIGWDKTSGKKLLAATRVVKPRMRIEEDEESLKALADAMVAGDGAIIMARIRHRVKKNNDSIPRTDNSGKFIKALVDKDGTPVRLAKTKTEDGDTYTYRNGGGAYEGVTAGLIPFDGDFLVPDSSDDAAIVKDVVEREIIFDNLNDDVYRLPGREVTIIRNADDADENGVKAEVTWNTLGFIAENPVKAATKIQAVIGSGETEETITASWLGTHWQEMQKPHELEVTEAGVAQIVAVQVPGEISQSGLDVFKS